MTTLQTIVISGLFFYGSTVARASELEEFRETAIRRCSLPATQTQVVMTSDFSWNQSLPEILRLASALYQAPKRLKSSAYFDVGSKNFILKLNRSGHNLVRMPVEAAYNVKLHIEEALRRDYAQAIIFSDMGHSHFLVPQQEYERDISPLGPGRQDLVYEAMLNNPRLKMLYHTAEQLQMLDAEGSLSTDHFLLWRYFTRNLVGDNAGRGQLEIHKNLEGNFNTVTAVDGFRYWGAGFYLHAQENGCFFFEQNGVRKYFDLSLEPLPAGPDQYGY